MADEAPSIIVDASPSEADLAAVEEGLSAFNRAVLGPNDRRPLALVLRDDRGEVQGGLIGDTARGWLHVESLWVAEGLRGRGWGSRLLADAEREAANRGCRHAHLDTASFQAPDFYEKHGYLVFGRIVGFRDGHDLIYLAKTLTPPPTDPVEP